MNTPLVITSGDPAGIGPDICLQLFAQASQTGMPCIDCVFLGDYEVFASRAKQLELNVPIISTQTPTQNTPSHQLRLLHVPCTSTVTAGQPSHTHAHSIIKQLQTAVDLCKSNQARAIVTAPVSKQHIQEAGYKFTGHTEWLADAFGVKKVVMSFISKQLRAALVTTHLPLAQVSQALNQQTIVDTLLLVTQSAKRLLAEVRPRLCVLGLNPHAGEGGKIGTEDAEIIAPAVAQACEMGLDVFGPVAADSFFLDQRYTKDTFIIAMYHDQILPLIKYANFSGSVNTTLGLPIVRTSVDHGTAFSLAGTSRSLPDNLISAIHCAQRFSSHLHGMH